MTVAKKTVAFAALVLIAAVAGASPAAAQATRTWVSGVGDDANPCSRTAPCKTFAGAISKTAAGGEINCLDPGGFGAVTITKSLTIDCTGTTGSTLASLTNGIVVNDSATSSPGTIRVILRGLSINGAPPTSPGLNGIRFLSGASLTVENVIIQNFTAGSPNGFGISFRPSGTAALFVTDTTITGNGTGSTGGGILIQPTGAGGNARAVLSNVRLLRNANDAVRVDSTGNTGPATLISIAGSQLSGSTNGLTVVSPTGTSALSVVVNDSTIAYNVSNGLSADGANAGLQVGDSTIAGNQNAAAVANGAVIRTFSDNRLVSNGSNGTLTPLAKQ